MFQASKSPLAAIGKDAVIYFPGKVIPAIAGFLSIAVFTRLLSPEQYGIYVLVITGVRIASATIFSWLERSTLRFFEEYKKNNLLPNLISTNLTFLFLSLFVVSVILLSATFIFDSFLDSRLIPAIRIGIFVLVTQAFYTFFMSIARAARRSVKYSVYSGLESLGRLFIASSLIWYFSMDEKAILWGFVATGLAITLCELFFFIKAKWIGSALFSFNILKRSASYGIPLVGHAFGLLVLSVSDRYLIQYYLGPDQVGIYSAGYNLVAFIVDSLINGIILLAAYPIIIQVYEAGGKAQASPLLRSLFAAYGVLVLPVVFGLTVLAKPIIGIALGVKFQQAFEIVPWVAGGLFFWGLTTYSIKAFELAEKTLHITYLILFAAVINVLGNIFLIPAFGIHGAAISTFFAYLLCFAGSMFFGNYLMPVRFPWMTYVKAVGAACTMFAAITLFDRAFDQTIGSLFVMTTIGTLTYLGTLVILREKQLKSIYVSAKEYYLARS